MWHTQARLCNPDEKSAKYNLSSRFLRALQSHCSWCQHGVYKGMSLLPLKLGEGRNHIRCKYTAFSIFSHIFLCGGSVCIECAEDSVLLLQAWSSTCSPKISVTMFSGPPSTPLLVQGGHWVLRAAGPLEGWRHHYQPAPSEICLSDKGSRLQGFWIDRESIRGLIWISSTQ